MEIGDKILIVSSSKSTFNEFLGGIEGEIIDLTEKGIRIEWEVSRQGRQKKLTAWIPKSLVYLIEKSQQNRTYQFTIALPDWARLDVIEKQTF